MLANVLWVLEGEPPTIDSFIFAADAFFIPNLTPKAFCEFIGEKFLYKSAISSFDVAMFDKFKVCYLFSSYILILFPLFSLCGEFGAL